VTVISFNAPNAHVVALDMTKIAAATAIKVPGVVRHFGQLYQTRVRAAASGRPGPRAITGDYRRSITLEMTVIGGNVAAVIGTVAPQGRRLEYGYVGPDSLGRTFSQPPYPHFGPPLDRTVEEMQKALAAMIDAEVAA
jgi:hypothetical protein